MAAPPTYTLQIGFTAGAGVWVWGYAKWGGASWGSSSSASDGQNWQTVTGLIEAYISLGRQDELAAMEPARASFLLHNQNGDFSPENTASPYYPNVKPMKRIKFFSTFNGSDYPQFYGYIQSWKPVVGADGQQYVRIEATDHSLLLAAYEFNQLAVVQQDVGARIGAVLNDMGGIPLALRDLDTGKSTVPAATLNNSSALQHIQDIIKAEDGRFWISETGKPTFRNRHARLTRSRSITSQATFGGASGLGYRNLDYDYPMDHVINDVRITRSGGTQQRAFDGPSIGTYGPRVDSWSSGELLDDATTQGSNALGRAQWELATTKDPVPRLRGITLEGGADDALWVQILGGLIDDRITVTHQFPGALGLSRDVWIERIQRDITDGMNRHVTRRQLSAADPVAWWIWGTSKWGTGKWAY